MMDEERAVELFSGLNAAESKGDAVQIYLAQIRRNPELGPGEEPELGHAIQQSREAASELAGLEQTGPNAQPEKIQVLKQAINEGNRAKRRLMECHLRMAARMARKYRNRGIALMDLIQEANMALIKAVENWSYDPDFLFGPYAGTQIKWALNNAIVKQQPLYIPSEKMCAAWKVKAVSSTLQVVLKHDPTPQEVAAEMNIPADFVQDALIVLDAASSPTSLDSPVGEDGNTTMRDFLPGEDIPDPVELATRQDLQEKVAAVLSTLAPMEEKVVRLRFGFEDGATHSIDEVCRVCKEPPDVIKLAEVRAIRKLRHPSRSSQLQDFLY